MNALPKTTVDAIRTTLNALLASFLPKDQIENGVSALLASANGKAKTDREPDRVLTAAEVAERIGRCPKTVRLLAKAGRIRRVYCGVGERRASGYSERSVAAFISGEKAEG